MPYEIKKSGTGYKVFKKNSKKAFSKKSMSLAKAKRQYVALNLNSHKK